MRVDGVFQRQSMQLELFADLLDRRRIPQAVDVEPQDGIFAAQVVDVADPVNLPFQQLRRDRTP